MILGFGEEDSMNLSFLGAAGTVTGSKTLVECDGRRILVDCGLFQGYKNLRALNWIAFPFDPAQLAAVVLTHAHVDHCGALPLLHRQGFRGPIYATPSTIDLCKLLLIDSAALQQEEANYANKPHSARHFCPDSSGRAYSGCRIRRNHGGREDRAVFRRSWASP